MKYVAITACPTGIAHTYMAAEKLEQAAKAAGHSMRVETQGSIGVEHELTAAEIAAADAVIIAADKNVVRDRFGGKRVLVTGVADGISKPAELMERALEAPVHERGGAVASAPTGKQRGMVYTALMNGVSFMIPFVVTGGLMIAVALGVFGEQTEAGLVVPEGSIWASMLAVGALGFLLMIPILSGYIAYAIADRPGLAPGMIAGLVAADGSLYNSEAGAGFLGAIITGFAAGYLALWLKGLKVPKYMAPIMPIIVIPLVTTIVVAGLFIKVVGPPVAWVFETLTDALAGMDGTSAVVLGALLGTMIAVDMGGPINKTAFLFGAGLIPTGNTTVMGMVSVAICIPPIGMGLATRIRKSVFHEEEQDAGLAAMFMGFFGITEGAIPFAAGDPARVIPANMLGGAVGGALAGLFGVTDAVPHGGFIVVLLGAVGGIGGWLVAAAAGILTTAFTAVALKSRRGPVSPEDPEVLDQDQSEPVAPVSASPAEQVHAEETQKASVATKARTGLADYITESSINTQLRVTTKEEAIDELIDLLSAQGTVVDPAGLRTAVMDRESLMTTGIGEGVAMPHGKTDAVSRSAVAFAKVPNGVDWDSLDGEPARLLFLITVPEESAGDEHLRILAMLSRKLVDEGFKARLTDAATPAQVLSVLSEVT